MCRPIVPAVALLAGALGAGVPSPSVEVRARAIAPGEPIRIVVSSATSLASIEGRFLDTPVFMQPDAGAAEHRRWHGWAMVPVDQRPGPAEIRFGGVGAGGEPLTFSRTIIIEPKEFPEEQLSVSPRYVEPPPEVRERLARERRRLAEIYGMRSARSVSEPFVRPVAGAPTSTFGLRRVFNGKPRDPHPGLDLRAATGTEVRASGRGRVVLATELYYAGNTVILDHGGGLFTIYAHLSDIRLGEHEEAAPGQLVGLSGSTGRVTGPHLHWGAKIGNRPFDPTALLSDTLFE